MNLKPIKQIFSIILILLVLGCIAIFFEQQTEKSLLYIKVHEKLKDTEKCILNISDLTDFKWNRMLIIREGASIKDINETLGFSYEYDIDLKKTILFLYDNKILHKEVENYHPERPYKLYFQFDRYTKYMEFSPSDAIFNVEKQIRKGKVYFKFIPVNMFIEKEDT